MPLLFLFAAPALAVVVVGAYLKSLLHFNKKNVVFPSFNIRGLYYKTFMSAIYSVS